MPPKKAEKKMEEVTTLSKRETRSGRKVKAPARFEPDEVPLDDFDDGEYDSDDPVGDNLNDSEISVEDEDGEEDDDDSYDSSFIDDDDPDDATRIDTDANEEELTDTETEEDEDLDLSSESDEEEEEDDEEEEEEEQKPKRVQKPTPAKRKLSSFRDDGEEEVISFARPKIIK